MCSSWKSYRDSFSNPIGITLFINNNLQTEHLNIKVSLILKNLLNIQSQIRTFVNNIIHIKKALMTEQKFNLSRLGNREFYLGAIFTALFFTGLFLYSHIKVREIEKAGEWVQHTQNVINKLQQVETELFRLVSARRGYFITQEEKFLTAYSQSMPIINSKITELENLIRDNPEQLRRSEDLRNKINDLMFYFQSNINVFDTKKISHAKGPEMMERISSLISLMGAVEGKYLSARLAESHRISDLASKLLIITSLIGVFFIFGAFIVIRNQIRKKNEVQSELFKNSAIQKVMLEHAPYALIACDNDGKMTLFNKAATDLLGYPADQMIGKSPGIFHLPEEMALWAEALSARFNEKIPVGFEVFTARARRGIVETDTWTCVRIDGSFVPVKLTYSVLKTEDGRISGYMALAYDISKQLEFEEAIMKAKEDALAGTRAKSEFLANMSHEIRTPMNAIMGMAELLNETTLDDEQQKYVEIFQRAGESLLTIINDILDISKIEARHFELDKISFQLSSVVEKAIEIMAIKAHQKRLELAVDLDHDLYDGYIGDPNRLRQILLNLIGNSVKFTQQGEILVTVKKGEHSDGYQDVIIQVQDTGIGMSEDQLKRIFERFTQGDSSITREFGGTGLGLNISRRLVELMNGTIRVESSLGVGTKISITIRLEKDEVHRPHKKSLDLKGKKILVIDDTRTNRIIFRKILEQQDGMVYESENGLEALKMVEVHAREGDPFNIIIIDCRMPGMDGFTLAETIQKTPTLRGPLMMMLTSDSRPGDLLKSRAMGIQGYLVKPVLRHDLLDSIDNLLTSKSTKVEPAVTVEAQADTKPGLRILLVDDNHENRLVITSFFRALPWHIDEAKNGREALALFKQKTYDLILMDMQMPIMDGYTVTKEIRKLEEEEMMVPTPILALTAYALKEEVLKSLHAGCNGHLTKPIGKKALMDTIAKYTEGMDLVMEKELLDIFPEYLLNRTKEIRQLKTALESSEFNSIEIIAHRLKGSAGSFGLNDLSSLGARMEEEASYQKKEQIMESIVEYEYKLGQIKRALKSTGARALN